MVIAPHALEIRVYDVAVALIPRPRDGGGCHQFQVALRRGPRRTDHDSFAIERFRSFVYVVKRTRAHSTIPRAAAPGPIAYHRPTAHVTAARRPTQRSEDQRVPMH